METFDSTNYERQEVNDDFIIRSLNLRHDPDSKMLMSDTQDTKLREESERIRELIGTNEDLEGYFESVDRITPDKVSRPKGDTTFFTTAGIQHLETLLRENGEINRERFAVSQPVIRSQYMDKVSDGISTSFVNFSVILTDATPTEFIELCNELIRLMSDRGVKRQDMKFNIENTESSHGDKSFRNTCVTAYVNDIEIGECIYIHNYPVSDDKEVSVIDLGLGIERLNWGLGHSEYYFPEYAEIYERYRNVGTEKITSIIDCVRSMVLIAGDGIIPSKNGHGYRFRQFSKRFVTRNQGVGLDVSEIIDIAIRTWNKWGNTPVLSAEEIVKVIKLENDRNFNGLLLEELRKNNIDIYIDINQGTDDFLNQMNFSVSKDAINTVLAKLKQ